MGWTNSLSVQFGRNYQRNGWPQPRSVCLSLAVLALSLTGAPDILAAEPAHANSAEAFSWKPPILTRLDSLFIIAATGEPRFKTLRDSCEKLLIADSTLLDYLIANRLIGQTPRQRHYVEHLFIAYSDSGRRPLATQKLAQALPVVSDSLKSQLLHIGSELHDPAFLNVARVYLRADSEVVRKSAVRSFGMYPDSADMRGLLERIEKTRDLERQENLWALSQHKVDRDWIRLLPIFRDERFYNRQLVHTILDSASAGNWKMLARYRPREMDSAERLEWAWLASRQMDSSAQAYLKNELPMLNPLVGKFMPTPQPTAPLKSK